MVLHFSLGQCSGFLKLFCSLFVALFFNMSNKFKEFPKRITSGLGAQFVLCKKIGKIQGLRKFFTVSKTFKDL
jgi:hypothetical protein